ncbi:MAG: acetyl-CoA carboxylase biotin carboxyl carrier protein subunit [candidate division WOR-3 bacterium]|nr:MAG: acetyl-CoA carboxylase biotin carboxyl carrier protein subunit [candidate division WOR-3 bacterium]
MEFKLQYFDKQYSVTLEKKDDLYGVVINDEMKYQVSDFVRQQNIISFRLNETIYNIYFAEDRDKVYVAFGGDSFIFDLEKRTTAGARRPVEERGNSVSSPMPGLLVKVPVSLGDKVAAGATLAIVEAMKMQNELRAPSDGIVKKINFKEGDQIDAFQPIVELDIE